MTDSLTWFLKEIVIGIALGSIGAVSLYCLAVFLNWIFLVEGDFDYER